MRIGGVSTDKSKAIFPAPGKPLTFKRGDEFLAFYATPVWDMEEFHQLCPPPENEHYRFEKGGKVKDPEAPAYLEQLAIYARKRWGYLVLKSLEPSKIEWDGVSLRDPNTWVHVEEELKKHLAFYEFAKLMELVDEANALDAEKLEGNAESFFRRMSQQPEDSPKNIQQVEAENSLSSEPASDSE